MKLWRSLCAVALMVHSIAASAEIESQDFTYDYQHNLKMTRYTSSERLASGLSPCIIFAFGGGFTHGDRNDSHYMEYFRFMAEIGYVVCTVDYRTTLSGFNPGEGNTGLHAFGMAMVNAVQTATSDYILATSYILNNASEWGIDPTMIVASGSSAGAITALQAEYTLINNRPEGFPEEFNYAAAVTFAGAILTQGKPQSAERFCPTMMFHGDADSNVPYDSLTLGPIGLYGSHYLATLFKDSGCAGAFRTQLGADHSMALTPMESNLYDIAGFLQRTLCGGTKEYD